MLDSRHIKCRGPGVEFQSLKLLLHIWFVINASSTRKDKLCGVFSLPEEKMTVEFFQELNA